MRKRLRRHAFFGQNLSPSTVSGLKRAQLRSCGAFRRCFWDACGAADGVQAVSAPAAVVTAQRFVETFAAMLTRFGVTALEHHVSFQQRTIPDACKLESAHIILPLAV